MQINDDPSAFEKEGLKVSDWIEDNEKLFSKSWHSELKDLLSLKRDLTSKLLNSLNSKSTTFNKGNNMLIYEDSNEWSQNDLNIIENKTSSDENQIEVSTGNIVDKILIDDKEAFKEKIVEDLLTLLIIEAKDSLFPQRNNIGNQFISNDNGIYLRSSWQMFPR